MSHGSTQHALSWPEAKDIRFLARIYRTALRTNTRLNPTATVLAAVGRLEQLVERCQGERTQ